MPPCPRWPEGSPLRPRIESLWRHRGFRTFWAGQTVSALGTQVTLLALPLTAVLVLNAGAAQMGALVAAQSAPALLVGLLAGAWVDRWPKRPVLIASALGRAALLASVPAAHALDRLRIEQLYAVGFLVGVLGTFSAVASGPFLLALVRRDRITEANAKLSLGGSTVDVVGPGLAGVLVQTLTAPIAIVLDAVSFVVSALALGRVRAPESPPDARAQSGIWREIAEGLRATMRHALVGRVLLAATVFEFFDSAFFSLYTLYVTRELGIEPAAIGAVFALGGAGGIVGALLAERAARWVGVGWAMAGGLVLAGAGDVLIPLASVAPAAALPLLATAELLVVFGTMIFGINQYSLRLAAIPDRLQGRANATARTLAGAASTFGPLAGGLVAAAVGLTPLFVAAAASTLLGGFWLVFSPVRRVRELPAAGG